MADPRTFPTPTAGTEANFVNVNFIVNVKITATGDDFAVNLVGVDADPIVFPTLAEAEVEAAVWTDRIDEAP